MRGYFLAVLLSGTSCAKVANHLESFSFPFAYYHKPMMRGALNLLNGGSAAEVLVAVIAVMNYLGLGADVTRDCMRVKPMDDNMCLIVPGVSKQSSNGADFSVYLWKKCGVLGCNNITFYAKRDLGVFCLNNV